MSPAPSPATPRSRSASRFETARQRLRRRSSRCRPRRSRTGSSLSPTTSRRTAPPRSARRSRPGLADSLRPHGSRSLPERQLLRGIPPRTRHVLSLVRRRRLARSRVCGALGCRARGRCRRGAVHDGAAVLLGDEGLPLATTRFRASAESTRRIPSIVFARLHLFEPTGHLGIDPSIPSYDATRPHGRVWLPRFGSATSCSLRDGTPRPIRPRSRSPRPSPSGEAEAESRGAPEGCEQDGLDEYVQREISVIRVYEAAEIASPRSRIRLAAALAGFTAREHAHGARRRLRGR